MAENIQRPLHTYFIEPEIPPDQRVKLEAAAKLPQFEHSRSNVAREWIRDTLVDSLSSAWANLKSTRQGNRVVLEWKVNSQYPSRLYYVTLTGSEMRFEPTMENMHRGLIATGNGTGSVTLDLEEGHGYMFTALFLDKTETTGGKIDIKGITMPVIIPLSDESIALLVLARKVVAADPAERLQYELDNYRSTQDAFDTKCSKEIEKIKAKGLSPEDEREQIEDFMDFARQARARYQT